MRKSKIVVSLSLVLAMTVSLLAGCGGTSKSSSSKGSTSDDNGLKLSVCIASEPETIDPTLNSANDGVALILHTFEGLMKFEPSEDGTGTVVKEGQAKSYEVSDDNMTYTFHLRDDIKWSDGQDVTSKDFVYSWQRLVNPATASDYATFINFVVNAEDIVNGKKDVSELGIEAPDDKTFIVHLVAPTTYFISVCANPQLVPLREDVVEGNDSWTFDPSTYISNGPYTLTEWNHDESIIMNKSDTYYDKDNVTTSQITWKLMADSNAIYAGFQSGDLDMITQVPVEEAKTLLDNGTLKTLPLLGTYCAVFNTEKAPFDNAKVRLAFSLAIDRNYICDKVTQTGEVPADAWVPDGIDNGSGGNFREEGNSYYSVDQSDYETNCQKAKELLAEAGYPDGKGFPVVEYLYNTSDAHQKIYEALEDMWSTVLGVTVTGSNQDWNVFLSTRQTGDFQVARNGWTADFNDAMNFLDLYTTSKIDGNNYSRWSNKEYDQLISDATKEGDPTARDKMLHQAEDLLMDDAVVAPLYFYVDKYCMNDEITGLYHTPLGLFFYKYCKKK